MGGVPSGGCRETLNQPFSAMRRYFSYRAFTSATSLAHRASAFPEKAEALYAKAANDAKERYEGYVKLSKE